MGRHLSDMRVSVDPAEGWRMIDSAYAAIELFLMIGMLTIGFTVWAVILPFVGL
jgi:hypothetical protein